MTEVCLLFAVNVICEDLIPAFFLSNGDLMLQDSVY